MPTITADTYLVINDIPMATPAWEITDLSPLLNSPELRGGDRLVPGADGVIGHVRRRTVTVVTLPVVIFGDVDQDGDPYDDPRMGMVINREYLEDNLGIAYPSGDGTVLVEWERRDGSTSTAWAHVLGFRGSATVGSFTLRTTLDLSLRDGRFEQAGS